MIPSTRCSLVFLVAAFSFAVFAIGNSTVARMTDAVLPGDSCRNLPNVVTTRHYSWEDTNSWKLLSIQGDREIVDAGSPALRFTVGVTIDPLRLRNAVDSYGVPDSWARYSYRTEEEKRLKEKELAVRCAARGVVLDYRSNSMGTDYPWVVGRSREDVREAALRLTDAGKKAGYENSRRMVELIASFVQSMEYRVPPESRPGLNGEKIRILGLTMPLETLYNGCGDCDTKSVLFASLMANFADTRLVLLRGAGHVFVGVRAEPRSYERYIRLRGENFVLVELTHPRRVGHIPNEYLHALELKQMEVIPLFK